MNQAQPWMTRLASRRRAPLYRILLTALPLLVVVGFSPAVRAEEAPAFTDSLFQASEPLKAVDSVLAVKVGDPMPDFDLPTIDGGRVRRTDFVGKKKLVLSFVPAAWTPVCSGQWPGYNIARELFAAENAELVGVSVDNVPSLHAWVTQMGGLWFPVASDFWPHGALSGRLGILRPEGVAERALFIVDEKGVIRYIDVHDINARPDLGALITALRGVKD
ncbi:redoxin domain-containing protein [Desulfovibrio sulfodismutans]|uniref:Redoxin domain-containing protein n=1 Tax=Desulfolutivibrio sulfodismutans TaxID=63561 RepID=A0A7K3NMG3_9BACT|nr:redoxin domain-containing protein [Desulfolutivibrio sulfodismutans]NDY57013.1 redoxin domain-containing protein [Desulfolutivibrio sulfodismutans]QLA12689.1 redoxin domain-containing protein [Desulfolutivibrio sulfodismutans DSM 3696]